LNLIYFVISCSCPGLLFFADPVVAWHPAVSTPLSASSPAPQSQSFCRRPETSTHQTFRRYTTVATGITTASLLSPVSLAVQEDYRPLENMIANNNAVAFATGISAFAIIASALSWRRIRNLQNELDSLKEEKRKATPETQGATDTKILDKNKQDKRMDASSILASQGTSAKKTETTQDLKIRQTEKEVGEEEQKDLAVMRIGVIRSIYRLCVGTPRQGLLAPDARGRIELDKIGNSSTAATVSGLEEFSYIWVLFHFHLNTQSAKKERRFKSKIAPPALGGKKVGIYATRSPHRHNPIGITLCKLDRIQVHGPHNVTLHVSGLDLVDGTPVLDIKPYVPVYDSVNAFADATHSSLSPEPATEASESPSLVSNGSEEFFSLKTKALQLSPPQVPEWVEGGLATKRSVVITERAKNDLKEILREDAKALEFYGPHCYCDRNVSADSTINTTLRVIEQVLSIDVRSSHQTRKARTGRSQAERAARVRSRFDVKSTADSNNNGTEGEQVETKMATQDVAKESPVTKMCTQQLDNLLVYFSVKEVKAKRDPSQGSGAEDGITVESIKFLPYTEIRKGRRR